MRYINSIADRMIGRLAPKATAVACIKTGQVCPYDLAFTTGCNGTRCTCFGMPGGLRWVCT
jgi:hypothetical protein